MESNFENTHGELIILPGIGTAFIAGVPDACDHKGAQDAVYQTASGKLIYWHTYRQWASYTQPLRDRLIHDYHDALDDPITMGTTQCRKCKKIFMPNLFL